MTISQNADTLTVEEQSPSGVIRWVHRLDGSESKNVIKQANPPMESVQVSTTTWDGNSLVTRTPVPPFVLTNVMRLEGATLVMQVTKTIEATGVVQSRETYRYSK